MANPREAGGGDGEAEANEERTTSCHYTSSSMMLTSYEEAAFERHVGEAALPPTAQQMELRRPSSGRIPAAVFERSPSESNKDWSMMSTESVFGLQVAPSGDFTGFFLAHPELMDISTPPRPSSAVAISTAAAAAAAAAAAEPVLSPHFKSIPERGEPTMQGHCNYSFAFPNLIEDKRHSTNKARQEEPAVVAPEPATMVETAAPAAVETETSSGKPEETPAQAPAKGGFFSFLPCCS